VTSPGPDTLPPGLGDVVVARGDVRVPTTAQHAGVLWRAEGRRFWLHVPEVADYLVEDGATITVQDAAGGADPAAVERHLLAAPVAALWMMRGVAVLGASVAAGPDGAVAVCGHAGAGKSSLVSELLDRGWDLVADGVAPVVVEAGVPYCLPAADSVWAWDDIDVVRRPWVPAPVPLAAVVLLSSVRAELAVSAPRAGLDRFLGLHENRYLSSMTGAVLGTEVFLRTMGEVARSSVTMVDVERPSRTETRAVLADLVIELVAGRAREA
jgi:hypothetical protein